jgi:hypothetical protein
MFAEKLLWLKYDKDIYFSMKKMSDMVTGQTSETGSCTEL